jgi:hypothetical protein
MPVERKYQVFVSSTYTDLKPEREKTQQALLEADCIPIAMELFPPSDEDQWQFIQRVIEQCDYYVLILAGRYGQTEKSSRLSYTEKEYRFADSIRKPIITFFHRDPGSLPHKDVEADPKNQRKLELFRELALSKLAKPYSSPHELYGCVIQGINRLKQLRPEGGWIPAKYFPSEDVQGELRSLRSENASLRKQLDEVKSGKGTVLAIDSMPNHVAARPSMRTLISESLRTTDTVVIRIMAVSLHYSWDLVRNDLPPLLGEAAPHKKVRLELLMVDPDYLGQLRLADWRNKGRNVKSELTEFIRDEKREGGLISTGRLELFAYQYRNLPHWHGTLINNHFLFLGRTRWSVQPEKGICKLTVGEETYRLFASNDYLGGPDRIAMFNSWFDYYKYVGTAIAAESVTEG